MRWGTLRQATTAIGWCVAMAGAAPAALAEEPPVNWSGFYVGAHAGLLNGHVSLDEPGSPGYSGSISGFIGGPLAGYRFMPTTLAFAIEGDVGFGNVTGTGTSVPLPPPPPPASEVYFYRMQWNAHLRVLAGLPMGSVTPFVAGGLAFADFDVSEENEPSFGGVYTGWTIGGGADFDFTPKVSGRLEVLYDDYGSKTYDEYTVRLTAWTARVALIFRLGG